MEAGHENTIGASHQYSTLTRWDRIKLFARVLGSLPSIVVHSVREVLGTASFSTRSIKRILLRNAAKIIGGQTSASVGQALEPPSGDTISGFCKSQHIPYQTTVLSLEDVGLAFSAARLHHIPADMTAPRGVLLYFHGGGYLRPAMTAQLKLALLLAQTLRSRTLSFLEYTLAPGGKYPTQLAQGAAALRHLLQTHPSEEIFIAGDSAGGNLALGLLAHLNEPHPHIQPITADVNLAGALCISPRCSNATTSASFIANEAKDVIDARIMRAFVEAWVPAEDVWAEANRGTRQFWTSLKAKKILLVAGEDECYVDDILAFADLLGAQHVKSAGLDTDRLVAAIPGAFHDQVVLDIGLGIHDGEMWRALSNWAKHNQLRSESLEA